MLNTWPRANVESTAVPVPETGVAVAVIVVVAVVATEYSKALSRSLKIDSFAVILIANDVSVVIESEQDKQRNVM